MVLARDERLALAYERYASEHEHEPFRVLVTLRNTRVIAPHPIMLDSTLGRCVVELFTHGGFLSDDGSVWDVPVPLRRLWQDASGLPLWAATCFTPLEDVIDDAQYLHKRRQPGYWVGTRSEKYAPGPTQGRARERQIVYEVQAGCRYWQASGIGRIADVQYLLDGLYGIGKRTNVGFGEIARVEVTPADDFALVRDGALTRPIPAGARHLLGDMQPAARPLHCPWTPPYWRPELGAPGWRAGARVLGG